MLKKNTIFAAGKTEKLFRERRVLSLLEKGNVMFV
jgi:hypothetical protein